MLPVPDRSHETFLTIIKRYIRQCSVIVSDYWKVSVVKLVFLFFLQFQAFDTLKDEGYTHNSVNHSVSFIDHESQPHTISNLEYNRRKKYFNEYVQKFIFLR